ncbi:hypothetical protein DFH28DRAFT_219723 [Melampsora americana]|nr:hypothetical protein DFH28DRAFT_219723 [Melampsora americana]
MSYAARSHAQNGGVDQYSPPRHNGNDENYNGAYGRDGAPASKFMTPIESAYHPPAPHRPNIAPAEHTLPQSRLHHGEIPLRLPQNTTSDWDPAASQSSRRSPSPAAGHPRYCSPLPEYPRGRSSPSSPPMYYDAQGNEKLYANDSSFSAPRPVFVDPAPKPVSGNATYLHGQPIGNDKAMNEKASITNFRDNDGEDVWRRIGQEIKTKPDETWLSRQAAAGSKFKFGAWLVAIVVLTAIGGFIAYIVLRHTTPSAPRALTWANGAKEVPTFGVNSTTNANSTMGNTTPTTGSAAGPASHRTMTVAVTDPNTPHSRSSRHRARALHHID